MNLILYLLCVWVFNCLTFDATATPRRIGRIKLRDQKRQTRSTVPHLPRDRRGRRYLEFPKSVKTDRRTVTRTRKTAEDKVQAITSNAFIEFDMRRAFIPKMVVSKKPKSITNTNRPYENTQTVVNEKNAASDSESGNIDEKVLDRIQQLEKELIVMKDRVKNDTETIDDLKSKVLQKDKEVTELDFNNESLSKNGKAVENQKTATSTDDFSSIAPMGRKTGFSKHKRVQRAGRKQFDTGHRAKETDQIYDFEDNTQPINEPTDNPTYPIEENGEYDQFNADDKKEIGQIHPGDAGLGIDGETLMNYEDFKKKLHEERIENGIDWKHFDTQAFLNQMSAEIKARTTPLPEYPDVPQLVPESGRRMLSDDGFNLTNTNVFRENKRTYHKITQLYAPGPPKQRKLILTTVLPEPTEPLPSYFGGFNTNNNDYPPNEFSSINRRRNLAPQAGKQKIFLDSTELLIRSFLGRMNKGRPEAKKPYEYEAIRQKMYREGVKRRQTLHDRVAQRMNQKISGRRSMGPDDVIYDSKELLKDPFLNDSLI